MTVSVCAVARSHSFTNPAYLVFLMTAGPGDAEIFRGPDTHSVTSQTVRLMALLCRSEEWPLDEPAQCVERNVGCRLRPMLLSDIVFNMWSGGQRRIVFNGQLFVVVHVLIARVHCIGLLDFTASRS